MTRDEARAGATALLRDTLKNLPDCVTSISVGVVCEATGGGRPMPHLRATLVDPDGAEFVFPEDIVKPIDDRATYEAWDDVARVENARLCKTVPFLFALDGGELFTVMRADLGDPR